MRTLRNHLRIIFSQIQPELLINDLTVPKTTNLRINSTDVGALTYHHCSGSLLGNLTYEEIDVLYEDMMQTIKQRGKSCGGASVFALIPEYTLKVLRMKGNEPICRQDQLLNWRYCYLYLGQDLLTTAHLAYINSCEFKELSHFTWPALINSDDRRLCDILKKGIAENHFHLNGSTRSFDLSWICLMNHPARILSFFKKTGKNDASSFNEKFQENLNSSLSLGTNDNRFDWTERLKIACWIRANLLLWLKFDDERAVTGQSDMNSINKLLDFIYSSYSINPLCSNVDAARYQLIGTRKSLDYAITLDVLSPNEYDNCCRSLVGERAFLYKAFHYIYSGVNDDKAQMKRFMDLFYLYILIKTQFRSEMIQVNQKYGFKNFALYQDRKDLIFEKYPEYDLEAKNLSVVEGIKNGHVRSLEMRIVPKFTEDDQIRKIQEIDCNIMDLMESRKFSWPLKRKRFGEFSKSDAYFYVLHFPKSPDPLKINQSEADIWAAKPRNNAVRKKTEKLTMAIAHALEKAPELCTRIRGFDACTFEIGCRPEVFAASFRFLRKFSITGHREPLLGCERLQPNLNATYHAGEDFMDLLDGLRAIDEAVIFLELAPGERIGHAMALGVNASEYYRFKKGKVVLKKQDFLDNIIWALNKARETGIYIDSILKQQLERKAQQLIYEIYDYDYSLPDYFTGWRLRGDDPEFYRYGKYNEYAYKKAVNYTIAGARHQYNTQRIMRHYSSELNSIRNNGKAARVYSMYHFNKDVKEKGKETEEVKISEQYIEMVTALQEKMMIELSRKHIGIETNPSSNVLIGPFDRYEQHPIFRFYPVMPTSSQQVQFVSVNTDDQGVFDTSLAMEYSLLACTLRSMKDKQCIQIYNDDCIYNYLERIRENGFSQAFPAVGDVSCKKRGGID